ncbi:hypothetical protein ES708_26040 [subsurface metagenome]
MDYQISKLPIRTSWFLQDNFSANFTHTAIIKGKMEILSGSAFNRNGTKLWEMFTILCAKLYKQKAITRSDFPASL